MPDQIPTPPERAVLYHFGKEWHVLNADEEVALQAVKDIPSKYFAYVREGRETAPVTAQRTYMDGHGPSSYPCQCGRPDPGTKPGGGCWCVEDRPLNAATPTGDQSPMGDYLPSADDIADALCDFEIPTPNGHVHLPRDHAEVIGTALTEQGWELRHRGKNAPPMPPLEGPGDDAMAALMQAQRDALANPRGGNQPRRIFAGAASHSGAVLLESLERAGWELVRVDRPAPFLAAMVAALPEVEMRWRAVGIDVETRDGEKREFRDPGNWGTEAEAEEAAAEMIDTRTDPPYDRIVLEGQIVAYGPIKTRQPGTSEGASA